MSRTAPVRPGHSIPPRVQQQQPQPPPPPGSGFAGIAAAVDRLGCAIDDLATDLSEALVDGDLIASAPPTTQLVSPALAAVVLEVLAEVVAQDSEDAPLAFEHFSSRHAVFHIARRLRTMRDEATPRPTGGGS